MKVLPTMICSLIAASLIYATRFRFWAGRNLSALQMVLPEADLHSPFKPSLYFHMGPPKTATTSLQTDLTAFMKPLKKDNYAYLGRYYNPYVNHKGNLIINRSGSDVEAAAHDMLHTKRHCHNVEPECMDDLKAALERYRQTGTNVVLSDEAYTIQWTEPEMFQAMKDALSDDWNVFLIVGYRHFYDWMPSFLFQFYRMDHDDAPRKKLWPGKHSRGKDVKQVFPELVYTWPQSTRYHTSHVLEANRGILPVILFDLHKVDAGASVRTHFLCNTIPGASWSCQKSKMLDRRKGTTVMNTKDHNPGLHVFYDMVTTAAARQGLVDTDNFDRKSIREAMRAYNEDALNQTAMDLDLLCPNEEQRDYYLSMSLDHQRKVYGAEFTEEVEASHREGFERRIESRAFCWVDADTVFRRKEWKRFFSQFSSKGLSTAYTREK